MLKFLRFMLVTVLTTLCGSMYAQEEHTVTWLASSGDALTTFFVGDDVSLKWEEGGGDSPSQYSDGNVYFCNGNRLVVAGASDEVKITKVVITFVDKYSMVTCDKNGKNESSVGITNNAEEKTTTWTGEQNSVIFRAPRQTGARYISSVSVTYTGSAGQVEKAPKLAITSDGIADSYDMDANGVFVVYYANTGAVAAENAKLTLFVDGTENASKTIGTLNVGESTQNFWNAKYNLANIEAGEHQVYLSLTASNAEAFNTTAKTVNFTKKAPEATFSINAANVTVPYDATSYNVVAKLKNTSTVDATNVLVQLRKGISESVAEQTVESLVAGAEKDVTLTVEGGPFDAGTKTYYFYVNNKYLNGVDVTVEKAPVVDVYDLAVTDITGTLDLANESNNVRIIVQNNGNKDITDAIVTLKAGDNILGTAKVSAMAGNTGWCTIVVASEGLEAGELNVTATVDVENDATPEDNAKEATLTVKAKPVPVATFTLNATPVEVDYGAETVAIVVNVKNDSEVDATEELTLNLWNNGVIATEKAASLKAGEETTVTFTIDNPLKNPGSIDMQVLTADNKYGCYVTITMKEAPLQVGVTDMVAAAGEYNIKAADYAGAAFTITVKNYDANNAAKAVVQLLKVGSSDVLATSTVSLDADEEKSLLMNYKATEAGKMKFFAKVLESTHYQATWPASSAVEVNFFEAAEGVDLAISATPAATVDLDNGAFVSATYSNNGTAAAENAVLKLFVDGEENATEELGTIAAGQSGFKSIAYDVTKIAAGEHEVYVALIAGENEVKTEAVKVTFTKKAAEATLALTAADVEVELAAETISVVVNVKNTSDVAAENVEVNLYNGIDVLGTQTIEALAAGENKDVTFTFANFGKVGKYDLQAIAGKYGCWVKVTVKEAEEEKQPDLAITEVIGTIDLANETNYVRVSVQNNGNVNIADAAVTLKAGETVLGTATVSAKVGMTGFCLIAVASEGLEAGELTVTATVEVEGDATPADNTMEATLTVKAAPAAEATLALTATDVEVEFEAETISVVVNVKNTSDVAAENVEVKLYNGIDVLGTQTIEALAAGENKDVTFTFANFGKAGRYDLQAIAGKYGCWVKVTVKEAAEEEKIDMALTQIQGVSEINLKQENKVMVWYKNESNVAVAAATISAKLNDTELEAQTIENVKVEGQGYVMFTLPVEGLTAGEEATFVATIVAEGDTNAENNEVSKTLNIVSGEATEATLELAVADVTVELADKTVKAVVNVKNTSEVKAEQVEVKLFYGLDQLGETKIVFGLEPGADQNVTFEFANFEQPGTYEVQAIAGAAGKFFNVVVKAPVVDLAIEGIQGTIDLANTSSNVTVTVKNNGTVDMKDAKVTLSYGETVLEKAVSIVAGDQGYAFFQVASEGLEAGELEVTATVEAENDVTPADNTLKQTLTVKAVPAAEATFAVTAAPIEFELGTEKFDVVATVKNTSDVDAKNVEVKLFHIGVIATQTIETLAAGAETTVTFADVENPYTKAGNYTMYVIAPKAMAEVNITVKEPYVAPVVDLAVTLLQGSLDLSYAAGNISVGVQNKGNQDVKDAVVRLTAGNALLGEKTVNVKAGETSYAIFSVATEGLTAGELDVTATVIVEGEVTPDDNTMTKAIIVKAAPVAEPTFSVTAQDVNVAYGAESFEIKAVVKNTSDVNATNVEVKLLKSITTVETKTIETLAVGAETVVTFTVNEIGQPGKTATYYVQVAGKAQDEVTVTFEQKPEEKVVDLALTAISGSLSAEAETNYLTVFVENKGNVDVTDAAVTLKSGDTVLGTATVSAKAGNNGFCSIAVPATAMKDGDFEVTAIVEVDGDADLTNNTLTKMVTVVLPDPLVSIYVTDFRIATGATSFAIPVVVKNLRDNYAAKDVKVMIYDNNGKLIGQATIDYLAAGAEETIYVNVELDAPYTENTQLSVWASGFGETKTESFILVIDETLVSIDAIKALVNKGVKIYTLSGKQVGNVTKAGLYIVNGRKVYVK